MRILLLLFVVTCALCQNLELSRHEHGSVEATKYTYFTLNQIPPLENNKLHIVVFPISGDVEMYISNIHSRPTRQQFLWKSTHTGPNIISLGSRSANVTLGPYYVGIYGVWTTNFKILAYIHNYTDIVLDNEEPQVALVEPHHVQYFVFELKQNTTFTISSTKVAGYAAFYIDTIPNPTSIRHKWYMFVSSSGLLTISNTERNFHVGKYYIGVDSMYSTATLQIGVTTIDGQETMSEGIGHTKDLNGLGYQYLSYELSSQNDLLIESKSINGGNSYLCISTTIKRPRIQDQACTWWTLPLYGITRQVIRKTDENFKVGTYYIGMYQTVAQNHRYLITASTRLNSTVMMDGTSITVNQTANTYTFYRFYYGFSDDRYTIEALIQKGKVDIFVSIDPTNTHPTAQQFNYRSTTFGSISRVNLMYSTAGWQYIGILTTVDSIYDFSCSTTQVPISLVIPTVSYYWWGLPHGYFKHYVLDLPSNNNDLTISTNYVRGEGDLFIGRNPFPSETDYLWTTSTSHGIILSRQDLQKYNLTRAFLTVKSTGDENAVYFLIAFYSNSLIPIMPGRPANGIVSYTSYVYYVFNVENTGRLRISLTTVNNGFGQLYASDEPNPNASNFKWRSHYWGPQTLIIPEVYKDTKIYISVQGWTQANVTIYELRVSMDLEILYEGGCAIHDEVSQNEYRVYQLWIPPESKRFMVATTLINGYTEIFMSHNNTIPTRDDYVLSNSEWPGNVIVCNDKSSKWKTGVWTIAVYGWKSSDYFLSAQVEYGDLTIDVPTTGYAYTTPNYYYSTIDPSQSVFLNVKVFDKGCVNLYVSQTDVLPDNVTATWRSHSDVKFDKHAFLTIPKSELDPSIQFLYVAVKSCYWDGYFHQYELTMSQDVSPIYVSQEVTNFFIQDDKGTTKKPWWIVNHFANSKGMTFIVDSCVGTITDAGIYGTTNDDIEFPVNETGAEVMSHPTSPYSLIIENRNDYRNRRMHLSMFRYNTRDETILAIFSTTGANSRPRIAGLDLTFVKHVNGDVNPHIDEYLLEIGPIYSEDLPLIVEVVAATANGQGNAVTVCGLRRNGAAILQTFSTEYAGQKIRSAIRYDNQVNWDVNVIVTDALGRSSAFSTPRRITSHRGTQVIINFFDVGFGAMIMFVVCVSIVVYLIVGMIFKRLVYKSSGINLIPNVSFWISFPSLFKEGFMVTFSCFFKKCHKSEPIFDPQTPQESKTVDDSPIELKTPIATEETALLPDQ